MNILLTGGLGFIGSAVIRRLIRTTDHVVVNIDKETYAASHEPLEWAPIRARRYAGERLGVSKATVATAPLSAGPP